MGSTGTGPKPYSLLLEACLEMWAYDELPTTKVQKIINAAKGDGLGADTVPQGIRDDINRVVAIFFYGNIALKPSVPAPTSTQLTLTQNQV